MYILEHIGMYASVYDYVYVHTQHRLLISYRTFFPSRALRYYHFQRCSQFLPTLHIPLAGIPVSLFGHTCPLLFFQSRSCRVRRGKEHSSRG